MILLNPGPVNLSTRVRQALIKPDLCHREAEFSWLQQQIRARLLDVYGLDAERWAAVLLTGSGTAAVEAMISSLVPDSGHLLVLANGVYGERMSSIAGIHGLQYVSLPHPWQAPLDLNRIAACLAENPRITHVAVVHHETTTGRLNDLAGIGALCRARKLSLLVDGVSSFGAERLDFDAFGITACAATANKCLHGAPGVSFVITRREALPGADMRPRSLYLDLAGYCRLQDAGSTPFTPSIPAFYALLEALLELDEAGGFGQRHDRYQALLRAVHDGLAALAIEPLLPPADSSVVLNAYHLPRGVSYQALHDGLKQGGFVIYAGQGALAQTLFRVSAMGAIEPADIERFVAALTDVIGARITA